MVEKDSKWILPKNLKKQEIIERKKIERGSLNVGDFGSYYAFRKGINFDLIKPHAISDDEVAHYYIKSLKYFLLSKNHNLGKNILDIGCAVGSIPNALNNFNKNGKTYGIDISEDAIKVAKKRYPNCIFYNQSADNLDNLKDSFFDMIHAREFYPFTRTNDSSHHLYYLKLFFPKLKPKGLLILQMVALGEGFCNTFRNIEDKIKDIGYLGVKREVMVPIKVVKMYDALLSNKIFYNYCSFMSSIIKSKKVGYFYILQKI